MEIVPQYQMKYEGNKNLIEKLLFQIYQHFNNQQLVDVTFKLSNPAASVAAHALILSAASPFFRELFNSGNFLNYQIEINWVDSVTFKSLITFCYSGQMDLTVDNVDTVLKAALIMQLEDAVNKCADFIIDNIPGYQLQRMYALEREAHSEILKRKISEYEIKNFMNITQTSEFLNFDSSKLQFLLESDDLNVDSEEDVYDALKRWYEYDVSGHVQSLPDLISCLRITLFKKDFIMTNIHSLPGCQALALEALTWKERPSDRANLKLKYTKPRDGTEKLFLALNLKESPSDECWHKEGISAIFQYDKNSWALRDDLKIGITGFEVIFMDDSLFFIGGHRDNETTSQVSSWHLKTKEFKKLPSMNEPRVSHSVAILNNKIYAIGGWISNRTEKSLRSVEMYSAYNGWTLIKGMITPRYDSAAVGYNGKMYVIGGLNKNPLKSVECYDPSTDTWTKCADMIEQHNKFGATVHKGHIFVACGHDENFTATVERYDPRTNEWIKFWTFNDASTFAPVKTSITSFQNRLWVYIGNEGNDDYMEYENYMRVYDAEYHTWYDVEELPIKPAIYYCFTVPKILFRSEK
ncbi:kelch-like protein 5 [Eurosta solidaginis]|uniref:kelch-like protein 5 n=1 Tax=Eurosta solidaginis TaxID=178769 RepID=UPI00353142EB